MSHSMEGTGPSPETIEVAATTHPITSSATPAADQSTAQRKTGKRGRVALACQRCKNRKQKCDGQRPACASCARLSLKCVYIVPVMPAAGEKRLYIKALEKKVAELESVLASLGHSGAGTDHLNGLMGASVFSQQGGFGGSQSGMISRDAQHETDDDSNDIVNAVRDLSLSASGHYVGATSNITIGRVLSSIIQSQRTPVSSDFEGPTTHDENDPARKFVYSTSLSDIVQEPFLNPQVAHRLIEGWFLRIATRYPALHTATVVELHFNRGTLTDGYQKSILHLIYAVSGRWLESAGETGPFFSNEHYDMAFVHMDTILQHRDSRTVDYLILMALYCTRAPRDPGAWTYVGTAMRLCIELGWHRRKRKQRPSVDEEMNKRRFWTTYLLERDISIAVGRPPSLSDHDIDIDLPFDINEDTVNDEVVRQACIQASNIPASPPTTLSSFIHRLRLKRIESEIQHVVYRVDRRKRASDATLNAFLEQLNAWKDAVPVEATNFAHQPNIPFEGMELYSIPYHRCVRFLLYPSLADIPVNMRYLKLCAEACAAIICDYRRLVHVFPVGFSALNIQSIFLAGLNLIYCAWLAPVGYVRMDEPLSDCQLLLYIVADRYPSARKYQDIFERIKTAILDRIAQGKHEPRRPVGLEPAVYESAVKFPGQWGQEVSGVGSDLSFMVNTMTGNTPFNIGMDSTAASLVGVQPHHPSEMGQFPLWNGSLGVGEMNDVERMRSIFQ